MSHEKLEKNVALMGILIAVAISFGGLAEIVPLMYQAEAVEPTPGVKPYPALQLAGRDVYVREGCYNCHSQMVRTLRFETARYGHYSLAGESVYDRPFQWGSKRTGPDLARVGGRYSDEWHRVHLVNPRDVVPESNMPGYPWLETNKVDPGTVVKHMQALRTLGDPYTDDDMEGAAAAVDGKTEMDAMVAYLQDLGRHAPRPGARTDSENQAALPQGETGHGEPLSIAEAADCDEPSVGCENKPVSEIATVAGGQP